MIGAPLAAAAAGATAFALLGSDPIEQARLSILGGTLASAAVVDLVERRIPNRLLLAATPLCLVLQLAELPAASALAPGLAGAVLGGALALTRPGVFGMGDAKLTLLIAIALGADAPVALGSGVGLAAVAGLVVILARGGEGWRSSLPLAPFLAAGCVVALL